MLDHKRDTVARYPDDEHDNARRFRDAALPYLDNVFMLARCLGPNTSDAQDTVQNAICERQVRSGGCVDRLYRSGELAALGVKSVVRFARHVQ
jgi:hypothetical protein